MRRSKMTQQIIVAGLSCLIATPALAQQPEEVKAPTIETSTTAELEDDVDRPETGPGSVISQAEHEPARPPT